MKYTEYLNNSINALIRYLEDHKLFNLIVYVIIAGLVSGFVLGIIEFIERNYSLGYILSFTDKLQGLLYSGSYLALIVFAVAIAEALLIGIVSFICIKTSKYTTIHSPFVNIPLVIPALLFSCVLTYIINFHCFEKYNETFFSRFIFQSNIFNIIFSGLIVIAIVWFITTIVTFKYYEHLKLSVPKGYLTINTIATLLVLLILGPLKGYIQLGEAFKNFYLFINSLYQISFIIALLLVFIVSTFIIYLVLVNVTIFISIMINNTVFKITSCIALSLIFIYTYLFAVNFLFTHFNYDPNIRYTLFICLIISVALFQIITIMILNYIGFSLNQLNKLRIKNVLLIVALITLTLIISVNLFKPDNNLLKAFIDRNIIFHQAFMKMWVYPALKIKEEKFSTLPTDKICKHDNDYLVTNPSDNRPNIIIISIDALRYDISTDKNVMPNLYKLIQMSYYFKNAYTQGTHTIASIASLNLSKYFGSLTDDKSKTFAELLINNGYETVAFSGNNLELEKIPMNTINHEGNPIYTPLIRGYSDIYMPNPALEGTIRADESIIKSYKNFLNKYDYKRPMLLWIHLFRPHETPIEYVYKSFLSINPIKNEYINRVKNADGNLAVIINHLKKHHIYDNSLIVLFSDHGDELKEHGGLYHKYSLYNELIHVPVIIKLPFQKEKHIIESPISLIDIYPTITNYLNIPINKLNICGESLLSFTQNINVNRKYPLSAMYIGKTYTTTIKPSEVAVKVNNNPTEYYADRMYKYSIIDDTNEWKLIYNLYPEYYELYNLKQDPNEKENLADKRQDVVTALFAKIKEQLR